VYYVSKIFHGNTLDPHIETLHPDPPEEEVRRRGNEAEREGRRGGGPKGAQKEGKKGRVEGKKGVVAAYDNHTSRRSV